MDNERVLAYVGSMSLYLKAVDVYTEAVTNSTKISKNLQALFSAKINEADPVGLPDLDNLVDGVHDFALKQDDKFLQKPDQKSYSFLKAEYDFFGVAYPKDGFFYWDDEKGCVSFAFVEGRTISNLLDFLGVTELDFGNGKDET